MCVSQLFCGMEEIVPRKRGQVSTPLLGLFSDESLKLNPMNFPVTGLQLVFDTNSGHHGLLLKWAQKEALAQSLWMSLSCTIFFVLNISKGKDFKTSLGDLCWCSVILAEKCILIFRLCFSISVCAETQPVSVCVCCFLSCHWLLLRRAWSIFLPFTCKKGPFCTLPSGIYTL